MTQRILVTGGAGFIGSHVAESLLNSGHEVKVLDNFVRGSAENIATFKDNENFTLIKGDICDRDVVEKATQDTDAIVHIAARIHVDESRDKMCEYFENNVLGTINVLESAIKNNVKKVVYASSCEIYGNAAYTPMDEKHPLNPASPYAATKLAADRTCFSYYSTFGLDVTIVRNFNIFGPRQKSSGYGGVIAIFIERAMDGKPPIIFGDGTQTRDYMYVEDGVQAYNLVLSKSKLAGEAINFGTGKEIMLNHIAQKVLELTGRTDLKIEHSTPRPGEVKRFCADITKAKKMLGFKPKYEFDEGLHLFVDWFKQKSGKK